MTTMTTARPAHADPATIEWLRAEVAAARRARRQRNTDDAADALRQTGNADKAADMTGLPLRFILRVAADQGISTGGREEDIIGGWGRAGRWDTTVMQAAPMNSQVRARASAAAR